ncbi:MAG: nucleotidyltransferase domain-containing protein [Paludibacter sp.]|nr:nucleotidyltransferase domain-containing protein [Paludibacter sp.]
MRLSQFEIETINSLAAKYFGTDVHVFLFGSRVEDDKKGGDIDLFIKNENEELLTLEQKIQFLSDLKSQLGDQKIDVVFDTEITRSKINFYNSIQEHKTELRVK